MVIFVKTKRIPLLAIQEQPIFVLRITNIRFTNFTSITNIRNIDLLSDKKFSRPFSRDRSLVKSA